MARNMLKFAKCDFEQIVKDRIQGWKKLPPALPLGFAGGIGQFWIGETW